MTLAFNVKHPYVSKDRWIASLSNGQTVFEDRTPGAPNAWKRLREYVCENNLQITQLRLQAFGKHSQCMPYKDEAGKPQLNGYWYMEKAERFLMFGGGPVPTKMAKGIGYVQDGVLYICWIHEDGIMTHTKRPAKRDDIGIILNHGELPDD
jgi:hypothetical protein